MEYTNWLLFRDILTFLRPYRGRFLLGTFFRVTSDLVWLYPVWAVGEIINVATTHHAGDSLRYFWVLMGTVLLCALYHFPAQDLAKYYIYNVAERIGIDARLKTIEHMFRLDASWHEKENSGNKIRKMHNGGDGLMQILRLYVDLVIESSINLVAITLIFFSFRKEMAALLLLFFVTYFLIALRLTKKASEQSRRANAEWEAMEGIVFEAVNNISTIKSLYLGKNILFYLSQGAKKLNEEIRKRVSRFRFRQGFLNTYQELFRQTMLLYTAWQVFQGNFEVGMIAVVLLYFNKMKESAGELAQVTNDWLIAKIAVMRMKDILNEKPLIESRGTKAFNPAWKEICIQNLSFSYEGRKILQDFSLTIRRGQKIGIVGLSGAGKSTLIKLLLKLYDHYEGVILIDDMDFRSIRTDSLMRHMATVPQETELFNLSLRENITLRPTMSAADKRFKKAIKIAHVEDFIFKLPHGVESRIGEKGVKLSGGEKQRVGIARAVYRHPQIILLDEATSHLDIESEKKIQDALHRFFKETTAIVIAHRLSTIREMDRIVVIRQGRVEEDGSFDELMKKEGQFYELWQKQKF